MARGGEEFNIDHVSEKREMMSIVGMWKRQAQGQAVQV
jgi:hypothetical protein